MLLFFCACPDLIWWLVIWKFISNSSLPQQCPKLGQNGIQQRCIPCPEIRIWWFKHFVAEQRVKPLELELVDCIISYKRTANIIVAQCVIQWCIVCHTMMHSVSFMMHITHSATLAILELWRMFKKHKCGLEDFYLQFIKWMRHCVSLCIINDALCISASLWGCWKFI